MSTYVRYAVGLNELWRQQGLEPTSREFANHFGMPLGRAKVALLRLQRRGLASRRKDRNSAVTKAPYRYRPTKRSLRRARVWGRDPELADEWQQVDLFDHLLELAASERLDEAMFCYRTRRNAWGEGFWREMSRIVILKSIRRERDRETAEQLESALKPLMAELSRFAARPERRHEERALERPDDYSRSTFIAGVDTRSTEHEHGQAPSEFPAPRHVCTIVSSVPPNLRWQRSHIVLEPAVNPRTGEFLVDPQGGPVYNQTYEPWQPEVRAAAEAANLNAIAAVAAAGWGLFVSAEADSKQQVATITALEGENRDLHGKLLSATVQAKTSKVVADVAAKMIELTRETERARAAETAAKLQAQLQAQSVQIAQLQSTARLLRRRRALPHPARDSTERLAEVAGETTGWGYPLIKLLGRILPRLRIA